MNGWIIASWVFVALLTIGNVFFFLKLKKAADQMMQMAFPGSKNMGETMSRMQGMMRGMGGAGAMGGQNMQAQMKMAMDMLQQMQRGGGKRR